MDTKREKDLYVKYRSHIGELLKMWYICEPSFLFVRYIIKNVND